MKIRNGFISNSSSTSFLITIKKEPHKCESCGKTDINIRNVCENNTHYESEMGVNSVDIIHNLKQHLLHPSEYDDVNELKSDLSKLQDIVKNNYDAFIYELGYHDYVMTHILNDAKLSDQIDMEEFYCVG